MAQTQIMLSIRMAWWAIPAAYVVSIVYRPFVGTKRALDAAEWVCLRGLRVEVK